jgi:hypothetical protein
VVAGYHEAWKAVVISKCLAKGLGMLRDFVLRNDIWMAAIFAAVLADSRTAWSVLKN